ncbi:glycosyltransferase [Nitratiruptor tergarcus]|uniref:Glycosyltransferase involved in cell wall bisynthesis n=1 Tax=Nitratiruptor tergarcus DSM 16512 TaxID=1069081 RepID=A0A1W1WUV3_9BACT|nr:glycosyltransferase [Nitratiruptor tergarcus]SMC09503.1 Glycosyltransferase involved in cell wall bisynthesis [Nitratiruptor tergarcus DSM 16512]
MNKKISILLAVKNGEKFISDTINSILMQTYKNFELIVVVNCSSDNTLQIVKSFKDNRIKVLESNICQLNYNLNLALSHAEGDYIARIDADDIAEPRRLEIQMDIIKTGKYDVVGSNILYINEHNEVIREKIYPEKNEEIRKKIIYKSVIAHPTVLCKKDDLLKVGGYLGGRYAQDVDLWIRLMRDKNIKFYNIQQPLVRYRIHSNQSKGNNSAFADVAGYMFREAIYSKSIKYFIGSWIYFTKAFFR